MQFNILPSVALMHRPMSLRHRFWSLLGQHACYCHAGGLPPPQAGPCRPQAVSVSRMLRPAPSNGLAQWGVQKHEAEPKEFILALNSDTSMLP